MIRIFDHYFNANVVAQMVLDFIFVLFGTLALGVLYLQSTVPLSTTATHSLSLATWTFVIGSATGIYQPSSRRSLQAAVSRGLLAAVLVVPLAYWIFTLIPSRVASSSAMSYAAMATVAGVVAYRSVSGYFSKLAVMQSKILILGTGPVALQVSESLRTADPHARIVGFFPSPNERDHAVPASKILPASISLAATAVAKGVDEVIVALSERRSGSMSLRDLLDCKISGIQVSDISTHFEKRLGQIRLDHVNAGWLIFGDGFNQGFGRTAIKRAFDLVSASLLLILTLPVMLVTAVFIAVESRGPLFYRQERVGLNGKTFNVVKFRSMRNDAERDGKPRWATAGDDRVTRVGRFIRRVRIDELPQLFNVLKGEMSLVGPRPERPFFVESLTQDIPYYAVRHSVKPGVTGWAQVRYDYGSTVEDAKQKLQYDLCYVKNHSLFLDLLIMFETVSVVLTGKGAR
jgi:sugar transferase (PEP-CTERM system associated)